MVVVTGIIKNVERKEDFCERVLDMGIQANW